MSKKQTDEYKTQHQISGLLTRIATANDRKKREKLKDELYEWTNAFWYQKFKRIRKTLRTKDSDETKCRKIQRILDCPKNWFESLI
ncbi:MAG: hypothetical protein ACYSTF_04145 [Planctomycetota bacterium]|jgi:hypothetical protein